MRCLLALLLSLPLWSFGATLEEDVQRYIAIFEGDTAGHNKAVEDLAWMGLSDPRLFDILERRIHAEQQAARGSRAEKDRVARYFRALGFSGLQKYLATLLRFQNDEVYSRYATAALKDLHDYARWNPLISNRATFDPARSDDGNRVMNMLRSDDMMLMRVGAKRVYFQGGDEPMLEFLAAQVQARYATSDPENADTVAWMVKAIARSSAQQKYIPLLEEVRAGAPDRKVRNQAESQLRAMRR